MEDGAYLGAVIAGALYVIAGARLARLSLRTGELPEAALATCFLCWGVSYFAYAIPTALADESLIARCFFTGAILGDVGAVAAAVFTWKVFRAKAAWARVLVGAIALAFVASNAGHAAVGDFEGSSPLTSVWYWLRWTGATVACAWIGVEASIQYRMAGRREALGLSDALVRNRLLLWGGVGVCWVVLQIVYIGQDIAWARTQQWPAFSDTLVGIIEFLSIGMVWIAFFPPRAYRAWIERRTPDAARAEG